MSIVKYLSFLFFLGIAITSSSQNQLDKRISFSVNEVVIPIALDQLAQQTDLDIAYSPSFFANARPVNLWLEDKPIRQVLDKILQETTISYKMLGDNRVLLFIDETKLKSISGYIEDVETGERLVAARIYTPNRKIGAITNEFGFFSLKIPVSTQKIYISSVGYKTKSLTTQDLPFRPFGIHLEPVDNLPIVVIDFKDSTEFLEYSSISMDQDNIIEISERLAQFSPSLNGQTDYVRTIQMLPGIQAQSDGFGGINVRGNESGQNLMLLDGSPIYIPYHLLGLYSTYNPETVKTVKLVKGNFPARYGGAVSSILDVQTREGDINNYRGTAEANLLNAAISIEGPLNKGKSSFLIAGRYSPIAYFFNPVFSRMYFENTVDDLVTKFYDLNIKTNYKFSKKDRLYLSFFNGKDIVYQSALRNIDQYNSTYSKFDLGWENTLASIRWNHLFGTNLFMNITLNYSDYKHRFSSLDEFEFRDDENYNNDLFVIDNRSDNYDYGFKADFDFTASKTHNLRFGLKYNYRNFNPRFYFQQNTTVEIQGDGLGTNNFDFENYYDNKDIPEIIAHQSAIYLEDHIKTKKWYLNLGVRLTNFTNAEASYLNLQPRFLARFFPTKKTAITWVGNRRFQYLHLIANPAIQLPNDLWLPSDADMAPQELYETEISFEYQLKPTININTTAYYRYVQNVFAYPETFEYLSNGADYANFDFLTEGSGESKGIELSMDVSEQKKGMLLTYTLSKSTRQFDSINLGNQYYSNYDNRHQFKAAFHHTISKSFMVGMNLVYNSPRPHINVLRFSANGSFSNIDQDPPGKKNTTRGRPYTRVDVNIQYYKQGKKLEHTVKFGVYNLFSSNNPAIFEVQYIDQTTGQIISNPLKSIPVLPNFSYKIGF